MPLIISVPGKRPAVCGSFVELLDLYPTVSRLCGLKIPGQLQGKDISPMFDDPTTKVREAILCSGKGRLYRNKRWALLDYGKNGELYDMKNDPKQYTNLYRHSDHAVTLVDLKSKLAAKLASVERSAPSLPKPGR